MILDNINSPEDLRRLNLKELSCLASEIREEIIKTTKLRGGHLAPNLGVVELTLALHYVFNTPVDKIVWDVGHQCYTHKLITGRRARFASLRTKGGISGFPKKEESIYDVFDTGHSGNSISVALGLALAGKIESQGHQSTRAQEHKSTRAMHSFNESKTIAVIGDGSIVTGMAFEALNQAGVLKPNLIVVLNDNEHSIAKSNGAMAAYLTKIITGRLYNRMRSDIWTLLGFLPRNLSGKARLAAKKLEEGLKNLVAPSIIFEELGFRYIGPLPGHSLKILIDTFERIRLLPGPILVHIVTTKGKGYKPAEEEPELFHSIGPEKAIMQLNNEAQSLNDSIAGSLPKTFTEEFGQALVEFAQGDKRICAVTAGMCLGTGLKEFRKTFPERFFDVGIAEQHAVSFASGLAKQGLRPIVAIYSTFLARAYDQIIQDVCLQNLPVVFMIDRAGIVGEDGPTHHGQFDLSFLRILPNMIIMAPKDEFELRSMLYTALQVNQPSAIRYPKSVTRCPSTVFRSPSTVYRPTVNGPRSTVHGLRRTKPEILSIGKGEVLRTGKDGYLLTIGSTVQETMNAAALLEKEKGLELSVLNLRFVKPLDGELLLRIGKSKRPIFTVEENSLSGGFGSAILEFFSDYGILVKLTRIGLEDKFIGQGKREELLQEQGLSSQELARKISEALKR